MLARQAAVFLVAFSSACGGADQAPTTPTEGAGAPTAEAEPEPAESPDGWKRFAYDDHASVLTPAQPEVIEDTDGQGFLASKDGVGFFMACGDVPAEEGADAAGELLTQARETRLRGRVAKAERDASRDGMRGVFFETTMTTKNGTVLAELDQVMVLGDRVCFLAVMAKEGADVSAVAERYFKSLRMKP